MSIEKSSIQDSQRSSSYHDARPPQIHGVNNPVTVRKPPPKGTLLSTMDMEPAKKSPKVKPIPLPYSLKKVIQLPKIRNTEIPSDKQNPVTSEFRVNEYYNQFMRGQFLFEDTTDGMTSRLKQRLQNRTRFNSTVTTGSRIAPKSALISPLQQNTGKSAIEARDEELRTTNRLTEMKFNSSKQTHDAVVQQTQQQTINSQFADALKQQDIRQNVIGTAPTSPRDNMQLSMQENEKTNTYYMFQANDFVNQKRLGEFQLSKVENFLEKGQLLYDATKVMQMTQTYIRKNFQDLLRKRHYQESHNENTPNGLGSNKYNFDPDANLPAYLQDRRHEMWNPLRENKTTYIEEHVLSKVKKAGKWDGRLGTVENGKLVKVDSLVESAYNSEKNLEWLKEEKCPVKCPLPSEQSDNDYNLFDSDESDNDKSGKEDEAKTQPPIQQTQAAPSDLTTNNNVTPIKDPNATNQSVAGLTPNQGQNNSNNTSELNSQKAAAALLGIDVFDDHEEDKLEDYIDSVIIDGIQLASVKHLGPYKTILKSHHQSKKLFMQEPTHETLEKIYNYFCSQVHVVPMRFLHLYTSEGWLNLNNFNLQANMSLALACTIPVIYISLIFLQFMTKLQGVKFRSNGIRDDEASMLIRACSYLPKFSGFFMEKNEVGEKFAYMLQETIKKRQELFLELSLGSCRNFMKISSKVCAMTHEAYLQHLDLSNTVMNFLASKFLGNYIRTSHRLQNLNISNCSLRSTSAREIANALLHNQSIKFLNISVNSFASRDYELASKIARLIQIHSNLIHLDLTSIQIKREEAMYIAQCLNDSSNIVSCHLTGNAIDYYSRLYLRSHLNAIVQYPLNNGMINQTQINAIDRGQILSLNHQLQKNISDDGGLKIAQLKKANPEYFAEILLPAQYHQDENDGLTELLNNEVVRGRRTMLSQGGGTTEAISEGAQGEIAIKEVQEESFEDGQFSRLQSGLSSVQGPPPTQKQQDIQRASTENRKILSSSTVTSQMQKQRSKIDPPMNEYAKQIDKYINSDDRIYDMFYQLDTYGFKHKAELAKQQYLKQFPEGEYAKQITEKMKQSPIKNQSALKINHPLNLTELLSPRSSSTNLTSQRARGIGTISEQNEIARFIAGLATNFDERTAQQNPMNGFLKELIFTRFIGHDDVELNQVWRDCNQCWICEKWDKAKIEFNEEDNIYDNKFQEVFEITQGFNAHEGISLKKINAKTLVEQNESQGSIKDQIDKIRIFGEDEDGDLPKFEGSEYLMRTKNQKFLKNVVTVKETGAVAVSEVEDKTLYNQQISTLKVSLHRFQNQFVPTIGEIEKDQIDPQLVMHEKCIPYKPFTKKAHHLALNTTCTEIKQKQEEVKVEKEQSPKKKRKAKTLRKQPSNHSFHSSEEDWSSEELEESQEFNKEKNILKFQHKNIFAEWWKHLPEVTAAGNHVDDIYLLASFNNWFPVKMDTLSKKMVSIKDPDEIEAHTNQIREDMKKIQSLPPVIIQNHIEKKYSALMKQQEDQVQIQEFQSHRSNTNEESFHSVKKQQEFLYRTLKPKEDEKKFDQDRIKVETSHNFAKLVPSGRHFFYFVKGGKYFCLSDRYQVKKFKNTNLFMNEIYISPKTWRISDFDISEVLGVQKKMKFDISKSIFKSYKGENDELLKKIFELDFKYTKIKKIFKSNNHECENIKNLLWNNFVKIKNIFLTAIVSSEYPTVSWNDFSLICNKCKIPDKVCNLSTIDRIFIATNVNQNVAGAQGDRDLVRYEFLEIIVRIANTKYRETGICHTSTDAVNKLLTENIFPNMEEAIPQQFRDNQLYTEEINELLVRNELGLKKVFGLFTHGQKRYMTIKDACDLINIKAELRFLDKQVIRQFGFAKMPHVDAINNAEFPSRMVFVEFLEFLGRIAFELFKDHEKMKDEPLHLKYDALLTKLFKLVKFNKTFSYLEANKQNIIYEVVLNPQLAAQQSEIPQNIDKLQIMMAEALK